MHVTMPYTREEEVWLEGRLVNLDRAYRSVSIGEALLMEYVKYSFDEPLSASFLSKTHRAFLERTWNILGTFDEFKKLPWASQKELWEQNTNKASALFIIRSQMCSGGFVQLQHCIGEFDNSVFVKK